jgi:mRNA interferase MazF
VKDRYVRDRGDLIWLDFSPQSGHEQAGRRPAVTISCLPYNRKAGLILACPITSKRKGYPFEVSVPDGLPIAGVILAGQVRSLDWRSRKAEFIGRLHDEGLADVIAKLEVLIAVEKDD